VKPSQPGEIGHSTLRVQKTIYFCGQEHIIPSFLLCEAIPHAGMMERDIKR
jgi:hypothetical protein